MADFTAFTDAQIAARTRMAAKCISIASLKGEHFRVPAWQAVLSQLNFERTRRQAIHSTGAAQ